MEDKYSKGEGKTNIIILLANFTTTALWEFTEQGFQKMKTYTIKIN